MSNSSPHRSKHATPPSKVEPIRVVRRGLPLRTILKVVLLLAAVDWWVRGPFFNRYVAPAYISNFALLRDRSGGQRLGILLDGMSRLPAGSVRVAMVGDSTMESMASDEAELPYLVREQLRARFPGAGIQTVHAGIIGLYGGDAALFVSKLLGHGADVIVWGVELRAFPYRAVSRFVTSVTSELGPSDFARLIAVGGGPWLQRNLSAEQVLNGLIQTEWYTYAYRSSLRRYLWDNAIEPLVSDYPELESMLKPAPFQQPPSNAPRVPGNSEYEWPRDDYGYPNPNWDGLEMIARLCARYTPGRCVLYAGPINPLRRNRLVDPDFYEEYLARLRVTVGRYGLIWRDYTDTMTPEDFRPPMYNPNGRDPIHLNETGRAKLAKLLADPVAEAVTNAIRARRADTIATAQ